jgi:uncharacterized membrane protein AbrB (regulator of aidB expression)
MAGPVSMHPVALIEVREQMDDAVVVSKQLLTALSITVSTVGIPQVIEWVDSLE